ncbi:MAG TPA: efflux transporter outer membrane subunit [Planctomycetota bacterium]|nr:efflux transporter outer membrane subunit [Planctomycetota bacterium]
MKRFAGVALLLSGCMVGPDYEPPPIKPPTEWGEKAETATADLSTWWTVFNDEKLNRLVDMAVRSNHDLRIAAKRVDEARAELGVVMGYMLPEINLDTSFTRSRLSPNGQPFQLSQVYQSRYKVGFDAAWEIDVFGGGRRRTEAAGADLDAWVENRRAVLVTLLGDVGRNYIGLRGNQLLLAVLRQNVATARGTVEITQARLAAGVATTLDVARAEALLASAEAGLPEVEAAIKQTIHRLSVLIGHPPEALTPELAVEAPIPSAPARVVVGLPSDLLLRRPDVRQAERRLAAATATIGVAVAELYPRFSLTGAFGLDSLGTADFLKWQSRAWSLGPTIRWPIFAGGRLRAQVAVEDARKDQALAAYEKAVLVALEDVENALVDYLREGERRSRLDAAVTANRKAVELADDLYRKGLTSFIDVLDAQRALYISQAELARSQSQVTLDLVALYKALGGGWESKDR